MTTFAEIPQTATPCMFDPQSWFPRSDDGYPTMSAARAKALCCACPKRLGCAQEAVGADEKYGIWAGFSMGDGNERWLARVYVAKATGQPMPSVPEVPDSDRRGVCGGCGNPLARSNYTGMLPPGWRLVQSGDRCGACDHDRRRKTP